MRSIVAVILIGLLLGFRGNSSAQEPPVEATDTVATYAQMDSGSEKAAGFSTITQTSPVQWRKVPQEKVENLQKADDYWYANHEEELKPAVKPRGKNLFDYEWFRSLLWILILCSFIAVVIWYLASSNIRLFRKAAKTIEGEMEEQPISDDIFSINYDKEIKKAEEASNYRLAVRLWYLSTLKNLADRNVINYRAEKPNGDYLAALFGGRYYRDFFRLTRSFEYTWYGQFPLSEQSYKAMQADFLNFKNSVA